MVLVANSLPAINDITAPVLRTLLSAAAGYCPVIRDARAAAIKVIKRYLHVHRAKQDLFSAQGLVWPVQNWKGLCFGRELSVQKILLGHSGH